MRMEELVNNNFIKNTDSVERYLLDIIKQYFSSSNIDEDSREYIIKKAVEKMKEELYIDNAGVVSINGQTGDVKITLEDLDGEPAIKEKGSAFNVNFGDTANTACMGNDPRLYDDRHPLSHNHTIDSINGLSGQLSTIKTAIDRLSNSTAKHENLKVLNMIQYSGDKNTIDLTILDTMESSLTNILQEANQAIINTENNMMNFLADASNELNQYSIDLTSIKEYANQQDALLKTSFEEYINNQLSSKVQEVKDEINKKISKDEYNNLLSTINKQYSMVYQTSINNFISSNDNTINYMFVLPQEIKTIIESLSDSNYKYELKIKYTDSVLGEVTTELPFIYVENGSLFSINTVSNKTEIHIISNKKEEQNWPVCLINASIILKVYTTNISEV